MDKRRRTSRPRLRWVTVFAAVALLAAACGGAWNAIDRFAVGDCFDLPAGLGSFRDGALEMTPVDCSEPHDYEVFGRFAVEDGPFPGSAAIGETADACLPLFAAYVGAPYADVDRLSARWVGPSAESWLDDDRIVLCVLGAADGGDLLGPQRGTGSTAGSA